MSFSWLGTFRQGSWRAFRRFILEERRDVAERLGIIEAEITRIGDVTVFYKSSTDADGNTTVTEERVGFEVAARSSLAKLFRAYIALGGNPFDLSLFLKPDAIAALDPNDTKMTGTPLQPYQGVNYPQSGAYTPGITYKGGYMAVKKYLPARVGGRRKLEDYSIANQTDKVRRYTQQEIRFKRNDIEARILKLCDLREQLQHEMEEIVWSVAGTVPDLPYLDENQYDKALTTASIVATIDSIFYVTDEEGRANFTQENTERLANHPYLLSDISPDEDNTAL